MYCIYIDFLVPHHAKKMWNRNLGSQGSRRAWPCAALLHQSGWGRGRLREPRWKGSWRKILGSGGKISI